MVDPAPWTRPVVLADVPVALYRGAQQQTDAVLRELVLMAEYEAGLGVHGPMRALFDRAGDGFADRLELGVQAAPVLEDAVARGAETMTVVHRLPERYADFAERWVGLLAELDDLCRDGTMLCVPSSDDAVRLAQWWCDQLTGQLRDGAAPVPWPEYVARVSVA